jgi:hypothetical protein
LGRAALTEEPDPINLPRLCVGCRVRQGNNARDSE